MSDKKMGAYLGFTFCELATLAMHEQSLKTDIKLKIHYRTLRSTIRNIGKKRKSMQMHLSEQKKVESNQTYQPGI